MTELPDPIARYIAAYNALDVPAMLGEMTDDIVFRNMSGGSVTAETQGKSEFAQLAETSAAAFSERTQEVEAALTVAETTLAQISFSATVASDLPNGWRAGQIIKLEGRSRFDLRDGAICHITDES